MATAPKRRRVNYLNNNDLLVEIQKSKISFCSITDPKYGNYDLIVFDEADINYLNLELGRKERLKKINSEKIRTIQKKYNCTPKKAQEYIDTMDDINLITLEDIKDSDVVFRVMDDDHIPDDPKLTDRKVKTNFKPFKQYILEDGVVTEVARSHWIGDFDDGEFSNKHGRLTEELGKMFMELSSRCGNKSNFRGYTYLSEMIGDAIIQLTKNALLFDESRESVKTISAKEPIQLNPFAYYTTIVHHAFKAVLNTEKKNRNLRDELLMDAGFDPSSTKLIEIEMQMFEDSKVRLSEKNDSDNDMWG